MIIKRILAFLIDWVIIIIYAFTLYLVTTILFEVENQTYSFGKAWAISFFTLTLPALIYFFVWESSISQATIGKQILKIKVSSKIGKKGILIRTLLKFLPWEIAHVGVHLLMLKSTQGLESNNWNWTLLIFPQILMVAYFLSIVFHNRNLTIYDRISNCIVISKNQK